jgi:ribosomal protein S18 acetylase RimI-like enzyme
MNITYRKATIKDKKALFNLAVLFTKFNVESSGNEKKFFWEAWEKDFEEEIEVSLNDLYSNYFIAENENGEPLGYVLGRFCKDCDYYVIEELFVADQVRGQQVGKKLMELAIEEGKKHSKEIRVEIFTWNKKAQDFYEKCGFKVDALILELPKETTF